MPGAELVLIEAYLAGITIGCNKKVYTDENGPPLIGDLMRFYGKEKGMDKGEVKFLKPDIITRKLIAEYCLKEKLGKKTAEFFYRFIGL